MSCRFGLTATLHDELREALAVIELDAVPRVYTRTKWRRWRYDQLARLVGCVEDWRDKGRIRSAIIGGDARAWMRREFRLWWTNDDEHHMGLLFTADPRTGMGWDRVRIAERVLRDGLYLEAAASAAVTMQPMFRSQFHDIERAAQRVVNGANTLKKARTE